MRADKYFEPVGVWDDRGRDGMRRFYDPGSVIGAGVGLLGGMLQSDAQASAASDAAAAQTEAARLGIEEQRRQFDALQKLLAPYSQTGEKSLAAQGNLIGLGGADAQSQAIQALQQSPEYQALSQAGQEAILQNASATGGLRGGNTQAALAQFQPQLLAQLINNQYGRLGGLTSIGQNAAAGVGNAGMSTGRGISDLMQTQGAAQAGAALAEGKAQAGMFGQLGGVLGSLGSLDFGKMFGGGGGIPSLGGSNPYSSGGYTSTGGLGSAWGDLPFGG